ncbi:MAG: PAS domain S-box protein, partial [Deltaproteobacteria bacterium]|nr:PAS domain S-box protein [Deltaproteobacteria bacterium]
MTASASRQVLEEKIRHLEKRLSAFEQTTILLGETSVDYLSVLSQINDGVYLLDASGQFVFVNAAVQKRSGISLEEFIGLHFLDIIAEEYHERVRKNFSRAMSGERVPPYELAYVTRSGQRLFLEINTQPVYKNGGIVGLLGVSRDITKRKKAEEALRKARLELEERVEQRTKELAQANAELRKEIERRKGIEKALRKSEHLLRTVFDSVNDCIFVKDRSLKYTLVNRCMEDLFGRPASTLVGKTDQELFGKEAAAHMAEVDNRVLEGQVCEEEDTKPVNNTMTTFHVVKVPIYDSKGIVTGLCGIARDMTRRKQAREALRQSEATVRALLNAATEVIMLTDTQGTIIALNQTAAQ